MAALLWIIKQNPVPTAGSTNSTTFSLEGAGSFGIFNRWILKTKIQVSTNIVFEHTIVFVFFNMNKFVLCISSTIFVFKVKICFIKLFIFD